MHPNEIQDLLRGDPGDKRWPPESEAARWERVKEHRRYYRNHGPEIFANRPELHVREDPKATAERQAEFTPAGLGREIAKLSAALLFSEQPKVAVEGEIEQAALDVITASNDLPSTLHDGADNVASEGVVGLRVLVDDDVLEGRPLVTVESADTIIWSERYGRTEGGVLIVARERQNSTYRLLEHHDKGVVRRRLYRGTQTRLGQAVGLSTGPPEFRELRDEVRTGLSRPTLVKWANLPGDDSDLRGIEAMLDALDDATTLGRKKARASAPLMFVNRKLANEQGDADLGGAIFLDSSMNPVETPANMAEVVQPAMQAADHQTYLQGLREQAISAAGYSLASWGLGEGGRADSGRALKLRQSRTLLTLAAKSRQAEGAISEAVSIALEMVLGTEVEVSVELGDGMPVDTTEQATEISTLYGAGLLSERSALRRLYPEWSAGEIEEEIANLVYARDSAEQAALARARQVINS